MAKLVIGCGYLGKRTALRWLAAGETVYALTRSPERAEAWSREGLRPILGDVLKPESFPTAPTEVDCILYAVGFDRSGGAPKRTVYVEGLANILAWLAPVAPKSKLIYVSSSSVYGQLGGDLVDESSLCDPLTEGGRICRDAEALLQAHPAWGPRSAILRMTGLYGPGRIPRRKSIEEGDAIEVAAEGTLNLIHVDDAAAAVLAAAERAPLPSLYCITDDEPVVRRFYYEELARQLHAPPPILVPPPPDAPVAERAASDKKVSNAKARHELAWAPQFPTCREGIAAILKVEAAPPA